MLSCISLCPAVIPVFECPRSGWCVRGRLNRTMDVTEGKETGSDAANALKLSRMREISTQLSARVTDSGLKYTYDDRQHAA